MRFPARRNLGPGIVKSPSEARNRAGIFLTKLGSGVALEGGRRRETGTSPRSVRRRFSVNSRSGKTKGGFALSGESHDIYEKAGTYKRFGRFVRDHMLLIINNLQRKC